MRWKSCLLAVLLAVGITLAPVASASSPQFRAHRVFKGADDTGGGTPDFGADDPLPHNPVVKELVDGKVLVAVLAERHFGHRIGEEIPLSIRLLADSDVRFDFSYLERGELSLDGSDFELVAPPTITFLAKKGKILWRIDMLVRSWVPKRLLVFNADVYYATGLRPDGKAPNWQRLTTPDFIVTTSPTADNGSNLIEGDTTPAEDTLSWFTYPLLVVGLTGVLLWPVLLFITWYRKVRPPKNLPPNELAWITFDQAIAHGTANGFNSRHYRQITAALRKYLGVEALSMTEALAALKDHPQLATIRSALSRCETALYQVGGSLSAEENTELIREIEELVPRP